MTNTFRIAQAAGLLGVSDDTVRRWIDLGLLPTTGTTPVEIPGAALAERAVALAAEPEDPTGVASSARNRFVGIVTRVQIDGVMAQVDLQCGPHRVVSLMSAEAARDLALEPGSLAVASVKATVVTVEKPRG
ncbi:TOBE domain-containing protein [Microbacterium sp. P26]|uniref:TOBE domain-containing protein n=1 Tax=Microbacterium TaxID=33882 RepID=UPI002041FFF3|nr:TOBE domain-containing protein [Microbacterium sp. P26]MCM3502876.1 TOBE domain-containing protein [Microbacterium sp. P26]